MALKYIKRKIGQVRTFIRFLITIEGSFKSLFILSFLILISFALDYFLHFPRNIRVVLLICYVSIFAYTILRYLLFPLFKKISDEDIAIAVEKQNPKLQDRLISSLQFIRLLNNPEYQDSRDLTEQVIKETETLSKNISFFSILNLKKVFVAILFSSFAICTIYLLHNQFPKLSTTWLNRNVLLKENPWPRSTSVFLIKKEFSIIENLPTTIRIHAENNSSKNGLLWYKSGAFWNRTKLIQEKNGYATNLPPLAKNTMFYIELDNQIFNAYRLRVLKNSEKNQKQNEISLSFSDTKITMSKGERLTLKIYTSGKIPSTVLVHYRNTNTDEWNNEPAGHQGKGIFKYTFPPMIDNIEFFLVGNDDNDSIPIYNVTVLNPPTVLKTYLWYEHPAYTGLSSTPKEEPLQNGNVNALEGTIVRFLLKTNIPIAEANLLFPDDHQNITPNKLMTISQNGTMLSASFEIKTNSRYQISLLAKNGLKNTSPTSFSIQMKQDRIPYIKSFYVENSNIDAKNISTVKRKIYMLTDSKIPLRAKVEDDYGINTIVLMVKTNKEENWKRHPLKMRKSKDKKSSISEKEIQLSKIKTRDEGNLHSRNLRAGDIVYFKFYAEDNNTVSGPGKKQTDNYAIEITEKTQLLRKMNERLLGIKNQIGLLLEMQTRRKEKVDEFLYLDETLEAGDLPKIHQLHFSQKDISNKTLEMVQKIRYLMWIGYQNNIWEVLTTNKIQNVHNLMLSISSEIKKGKIEGLSTDVEKNIINSYKTILNDLNKGKEYLEDASNGQEEIISIFAEIIDLLAQWEDFRIEDDIKRLLEEAKKQQKHIKSWVG